MGPRFYSHATDTLYTSFATLFATTFDQDFFSSVGRSMVSVRYLSSYALSCMVFSLT